MLTWFNTIVNELAKVSAQMGAHAVKMVVLLALEFGLQLLLSLPQFRSIAPRTDPILKAAIPITVIVFCLHLVYTLALDAWQDVRRRLDEGGIHWWTAIVIMATLLSIGYGYDIVIGGSTLKLPSTDSKKSSAEMVVLLDLTNLDERSSSHGPFQFPEWAEQIELQFRVPVEEGHTYWSQIDPKEEASIGFHPEGLFTQRLSRGTLSDGPHRLTIYRFRLGEKPLIAQIKTIPFEIQNAH